MIIQDFTMFVNFLFKEIKQDHNEHDIKYVNKMFIFRQFKFLDS